MGGGRDQCNRSGRGLEVREGEVDVTRLISRGWCEHILVQSISGEHLSHKWRLKCLILQPAVVKDQRTSDMADHEHR